MEDKNIKKKLKGTETEKNYGQHFLESVKLELDMIFADIARKEGYEQIGAIFDETSHNEREHAELWYDYLGQIYDTEKNLKKSSKLEDYESTQMYIDFAIFQSKRDLMK